MHDMDYIDELVLEILQEAPDDSALLDSIVLSVVLLRSGHSIGDSLERINLSNPAFLAAFSSRGLSHSR